ncbi:hypothetical protein FGO68_gene7260 [Halteria grandinella]|uniref:Uncharacterized protein n=1 Tax=Halteria grandinella TaxID=5974 RepID=A0A8J8NC17_HALGN|nr:hypothetical protein FGO68_gene7260 [Halteria grandinella]
MSILKASMLMLSLKKLKERLFTLSLPIVHEINLKGLSFSSESFTSQTKFEQLNQIYGVQIHCQDLPRY